MCHKPRASGSKLGLQKQSGMEACWASVTGARNVSFMHNMRDATVGSSTVTNVPLWDADDGGGRACVEAEGIQEMAFTYLSMLMQT